MELKTLVNAWLHFFNASLSSCSSIKKFNTGDEMYQLPLIVGKIPSFPVNNNICIYI